MVSAEQGAGSEFVSGAPFVPNAVVSAVGYRAIGAAGVIHRGVASPALTMVFSLDEPLVTGLSPEHAAGPGAYRNQTAVGGLHARPVYIAQPEVQSGVQLSVRPLQARSLFGVPAGELQDLTTDGADVLGPSVARLCEQISESNTWVERFAVLGRDLRGRCAAAEHRDPPRADVAEAWKWIVRHRGTGSMKGLARHVLLSPRQLTTVFRAEFGLTPKAASRLMRFENLRQRLTQTVRNATPPDVAALAHACGYFDHSHLVRDFQQYAGTSPTHWLSEERRNIQAGAQQHGEDWAP